MWIQLDLGSDDDQERLEIHLGRRGLEVADVLAVARHATPRRKGRRVYAYGRGDGAKLVVVVLQKVRSGWRPRTAWEMDEVERRWWRAHGGR